MDNVPANTQSGPSPEWDRIPSSWAAPSSPPIKSGRARSVGFVAVVVAAALIGAGIGSQLHLHGALPTLNAANAPTNHVTPSTPAYPGSTTNQPAVTPSQTGAIAAKVDPGVVDITTVLGFQNAAAGTGMIINGSGEILTNDHVISGATSITVTAVDTGHRYSATVVGSDPTEDIAVLQLHGASGMTPIKTAARSVAVGDQIVALGNAGGTGGTPDVVTGTVIAVNQTITASDPGGGNAETLHGLVQINAPIKAGDSGGPLVNTAAEVIGMNTAAAESNGRGGFSGGSEGYAIPIAHALNIAKKIEAGRATATIHIGVPGFIGVALGVDGGAGATIARVEPNSPAAGAGLRVGDTITSLDGQTVGSPAQLTQLKAHYRPGDKVSIAWTDTSGANHQTTITLAAGPAD
jgi:S1-C subfamily serine protease